MPTLTEICDLLGATHADHRTLRSAATLGALGPGIVIDGRGTHAFGAYAPFRAAIVLALHRARIRGTDAAATIARAAATLPDAVDAAMAGRLPVLRVATYADGTRAAACADAADPWPLAESLTSVNLAAIWAPLLSTLKDE